MNLHKFRPRLFDTLPGYRRDDFLADLSAGVTVGIVALPLAMAFAIASGVKPEQGIFTAIIAGFLIAALGGSNVQIGGPAGAFIVIVYGIVERYGLTNLLISTALSGVLLFSFGLFKLGALIRYIPVTIIIGFTNGIAVLIALSQVKDLLGLQIDKLPADFFTQIGTLASHADSFNPWALLVGSVCLAIVVAWPKAYAAPQLDDGPLNQPQRMKRLASKVPGTIVALILATLATVVLQSAARNHRFALRRNSARFARAGFAAVQLGQCQTVADPDRDDRTARGDRITVVCSGRRQPDRCPASRPQSGTDGARCGQHGGAVLRRHSGYRDDRPHRHQRALGRAHAGLRHRSFGDAACS